MTSAGGWYHCSVKTVSRSAGRSIVAAAAYRLGARMHDVTTNDVFDYRRKSGVTASFTLAPSDAPTWAFDAEALWNAAERRETRRNSQTGRECELALPAAVSAAEREAIAREFARNLVEKYGVAVTVALHEPSREGDERNFHAHILMTTRRMEASGLGAKTRVLDDRKTGPQEVSYLRELAADLINAALERAGVAERVDHRSFKDRGIDAEPTEHLGPTATEMEREGKASDKGDANRAAGERNALLDALVGELADLDAQIAAEEERKLDERYGSIDVRPEDFEPLVDRDPAPVARDEFEPLPQDAAQEEARLDAEAAPFEEQIRAEGEIHHEGLGGFTWWEWAATSVQWLYETVRDFVTRTWRSIIDRDPGNEDRSKDGPDLTR